MSRHTPPATICLPGCGRLRPRRAGCRAGARRGRAQRCPRPCRLLSYPLCCRLLSHHLVCCPWCLWRRAVLGPLGSNTDFAPPAESARNRENLKSRRAKGSCVKNGRFVPRGSGRLATDLPASPVGAAKPRKFIRKHHASCRIQSYPIRAYCGRVYPAASRAYARRQQTNHRARD